MKRAGTPCTRERGLRLGLTALRGASEGWVTGVNSLFCGFNLPRSEERVQGTKFLAGVWGLESRARCAGFSVTEIGNRKERLRVREAGASAAGRGQRPYASFPGFLPLNPLRTPSPPLKRAGTPCTRERGLRLGLTALRGASEGWVTGVNSLFCGFNPPLPPLPEDLPAPRQKNLCRMNDFSFCSMRHKLFFCFWSFFLFFTSFNFLCYYSICQRVPNLFSASLQRPFSCDIIPHVRRKHRKAGVSHFCSHIFLFLFSLEKRRSILC